MPPPRLAMASLLRQLRTSSAPARYLGAWQRPVTIVAKGAILLHLTVSYVGFMGPTDGISMMPTIPNSFPKAPWILVSALHRRGRNVQVGDLVTYAHPILPGVRGCKRVIGMPGDFVSVVTPGRTQEDMRKSSNEGDWSNIRDEVIQVPEGHCWIAGDNLEWSRDSRLYGPVPLALVEGKVLAVVLPWKDAKWVGADRDITEYREREHPLVVR